MKNKFRPRSTNGGSRCQLSPGLVEQHRLVDAALMAAARFLEDVLAAEEAIHGPEGQNAAMAHATAAMAQCFDWERLVSKPPTVDDLRSFSRLYAFLRPYLRHTDWPPFKEVVRAWPDEKTMQYQYVMLLRRVRDAPQRAPHTCRQWWRLDGFVVLPVRCWSSVLRFVCGWVRARSPLEVEHRHQCNIAAVLSDFLGGGLVPPKRAGSRGAANGHRPRVGFFLSSSKILACGFPWRGRQAAGKLRRSVRHRHAFGVAPGGLGVAVGAGDMLGKLVCVRSVVRSLVPSEVSASLDIFPYFARGHCKPQSSAWHAARLHHRCRTMGSGEACCERIGSLMRNAWSAGRRMDPGNLMDCVLLDDAKVQCIGGERDTSIVRSVARSLYEAGRRPLLGERRVRARKRGAVGFESMAMMNTRADALAALVRSGRRAHGHGVAESSSNSSSSSSISHQDRARGRAVGRNVGAERQARRAAAMPAIKNTGVDATLTRVAQQGSVATLPLYVGEARRAGRASSAVHASARAWLETEEGRTWLATRRGASSGRRVVHLPGCASHTIFYALAFDQSESFVWVEIDVGLSVFLLVVIVVLAVFDCRRSSPFGGHPCCHCCRWCCCRPCCCWCCCCLFVCSVLVFLLCVCFFVCFGCFCV